MTGEHWAKLNIKPGACVRPIGSGKQVWEVVTIDYLRRGSRLSGISPRKPSAMTSWWACAWSTGPSRNFLLKCCHGRNRNILRIWPADDNTAAIVTEPDR